MTHMPKNNNKNENVYMSQTYKKFQLIAFETQTSKAIKRGFFDNSSVLPAEIFELHYETLNRITYLVNAIEEAQKRIKNTPSASTLKVFIAPEFYFWPVSAESIECKTSKKNKKPKEPNTYTNAVALVIMSVLKKIFADPKYKHWLILPGTILFDEPFKGNDLKEIPKKYMSITKNLSNRNLALVIKGGHPQAPIAYVDKVNYATDVDPIKRLSDYAKLWSFKNRIECIKSIDGHMVGTEICADHNFKVLRETWRKRNKQEKYLAPIDLQLVTSCGMPVRNHGLAARKGGLIFHTDGYQKVSTSGRITKQDLDNANFKANYEESKKSSEIKLKNEIIRIYDPESLSYS